MPKSGICLFNQIVIFILKQGGKQTSIFSLFKNKYFKQPPVFLTFKLRLIYFDITSFKRWIAEWIKARTVIVFVIIQLSDHKSFWLRRFDSRQRLTHHFFIMANYHS